jgi:glutathione S-transferase
MSVLLYGNTNWTSPYALSCFVALREKGIAFEVREVALHRGAQWEPEYAKRSLTARVPLVVDGDFALSESSAVDEYLEDAYLRPRTPSECSPGCASPSPASVI